MKLEIERRAALPRLAWCARVDRDGARAAVGPWVETGDGTLVEGSWTGDDFAASPLLMGSGATLDGDRIVFASPAHALEPLWVARLPESVLVSNSPAFLLEAAGLHLDENYPHYRRDLWSRIRGLDRAATRLPTREGCALELAYHCNLAVGRDLRVERVAKALPPVWPDFAAYRAFLADGLAAILRRARDYEPLVTLSTGYDSPVAGVLAEEAGCRRAVTFDQGVEFRSTREFLPDSGARIGESLGLRVHEVERQHPSTYGAAAAAEFAACGDAWDLQFALFEEFLPRACLVTGFRGGRVWDRAPNPWGPQLGSFDPSGSSLAEFRLRLGFVHVPVPVFGAVHQERLHEIANSDEMRPWVLGGEYDRPIARRIVEERGIPREWFGQRKKGSFAVVQYRCHPCTASPQFEEHYRRHRPRGVGARIAARLRYHAARARCALGWIDEFDLPVPGRAALVVQWGTEEVRRRYAGMAP